jgi:hypothetical protein
LYDSIPGIDMNDFRLMLKSFSFTYVAKGHDNDQVIWAGQPGGGAVEADFSTACFPFDGIGIEAGAIIDIDDCYPLIGKNIGRF